MAWRSLECCNSISAMPNNRARDQIAHGAAKVDLLGDGDDTHATLTPISKDVDAFLEVPCQAVELPHNNRVDLAGKDGVLQFLESVALQIGGAVAVLEPACAFDPLTVNPGLHLGPLAVCLLSFRR